jgi:outer membrane protein TolC
MRYVLTAAALLSCFISVSAFAEVVPLDQVIARTLEKSPAAARVERDYQDRLAEGTAATTFDNPELQADVLRKNNSGGNDLEMELTQPLRLSHLTGLRSTYAETLSRAATTQQKYELFKTVNEVSTLYMKLWLLQERESLYDKSAQDAENLAGTVRGAAKQGQLAVSESTLFTADSVRLRTEIDSIAAEMAQTKLDLAKSTGFSFAEIEAVKPNFSPVPTPEQLVTFSDSRSTLRAVTRDNFAAAQQRLKVAQADAFPEFGPRLLYNRGFSGNDERAMGFGIAMRIPLWDTNQAERQRARAALNVAQADIDSVTVKNPQEMLGQLQQSAVRLQEREQKYWSDILPGYRKSYDLSRQMLRAGQIPALDLWQVREKLYQVEEAALQSTIDAYAARLTLELEIGGKLEEVQ